MPWHGDHSDGERLHGRFPCGVSCFGRHGVCQFDFSDGGDGLRSVGAGVVGRWWLVFMCSTLMGPFRGCSSFRLRSLPTELQTWTSVELVCGEIPKFIRGAAVAPDAIIRNWMRSIAQTVNGAMYRRGLSLDPADWPVAAVGAGCAESRGRAGADCAAGRGGSVGGRCGGSVQCGTKSGGWLGICARLSSVS